MQAWVGFLPNFKPTRFPLYSEEKSAQVDKLRVLRAVPIYCQSCGFEPLANHCPSLHWDLLAIIIVLYSTDRLERNFDNFKPLWWQQPDELNLE